MPFLFVVYGLVGLWITVMHEDCVWLVLVGNHPQISSLVHVQRRHMRLSRSALDRKERESLLGFCLRMLQISTTIKNLFNVKSRNQILEEEWNTAAVIVWLPDSTSGAKRIAPRCKLVIFLLSEQSRVWCGRKSRASLRLCCLSQRMCQWEWFVHLD